MNEECSPSTPAERSVPVPRVICLASYMKCFRYLFTKIRDENTDRSDFVKYSDRLMSVLCEEGFSYACDIQAEGPTIVPEIVITPTGSTYSGQTELIHIKERRALSLL